jgi:hypothetical protein
MQLIHTYVNIRDELLVTVTHFQKKTGHGLDRNYREARQLLV